MTQEQDKQARYWAWKYTRDYNGRFEFEDLYQEARLAQWQWAKAYDEARGCCYWYWIEHGIKWALSGYCRKNKYGHRQEIFTDKIPETTLDDLSLLTVEGMEIINAVMEQCEPFDAEVLRMRLSGMRWVDIERETGRKTDVPKKRIQRLIRRMDVL